MQKRRLIDYSQEVIAGSLESANSSILAARRFFKKVVGENQDFMLIRLLNARI